MTKLISSRIRNKMCEFLWEKMEWKKKSLWVEEILKCITQQLQVVFISDKVEAVHLISEVNAKVLSV